MITGILAGNNYLSPEDSAVLINKYIKVCEKDAIRWDCIVDTADAFASGKVSNHKLGRLPATDVFAVECRALESARIATENRQRKAIVPPKDNIAPISAERRKELAARLKETADRLRTGDVIK